MLQAIQAALAIIQVVRQLLPEIIALVGDVETALPASGQGAQKLDIVKNVLQTSLGDLTGFSVTFDALWPTVQAVIAAHVAATKAPATA